jgi:hypothetical protein
MRGIDVAYEVRIYVPRKMDVAENTAFSNFAHRTFGIKAHNHKQAETQANKIAEKHGGWVASVRKSEVETIYATENFRLLEPLSSPVTNHSAVIKLDEFVWLKRTKRIDNQNKDKKDIDNN